jgi:ABC-2 type transport system ATP-binding protein
MDEAEKLCDRIAIINRGKIIAMDTPQSLIAEYANEVKVIFTTNQEDVSWLNEITHVKKITKNGPRVEVEGKGQVLALTAVALVEHGITPDDLRVEQPTLEDVFLKLTGHDIGE